MRNQAQPIYASKLQRVSEGKRRRTIDKVAVARICGEEVASWKTLEKYGTRTIRARNVGIFCQIEARVKRFREEAEEERQAGIQGQWQLESPAREYLEQAKCCN